MEFEIFEKPFYGNTIGSWLIALCLMTLSVICGRVIYLLISRYARKFTEKTETKLDDLIIDMIEEPVALAIIALGIKLSLHTLDLNVKFISWIDKAYFMVLVLNIAWLLTRILDSIFKEYLLPIANKSENDIDDLIIPLLQKGSKFVIWSLGIVVALNNAGYDVGAILAGLGLGGFAFALAAKDTVSNIFGGLTIYLDQPFHIGEKIRVKGIEGEVKEIGLRSTRLESPEGRLITMPNSSFADNPVENISREPSKRIIQVIKLSQSNSIEKIERSLTILNEIGKDCDKIDPPFICNLNLIEDTYLGITIIFFVKKDIFFNIPQTEINLQIIKKFREEGIQFAENLISRPETQKQQISFLT